MTPDVQAAVARATSTTRRRIAQALHDDLQQHLHALETRVAVLEAEAAAGAAVDADALRELRGRVHAAVDVLRSVTTELASDPSGSLAARVRHVVAGSSSLHGIDVTLAVEELTREPDRPVADVVVDAVRELLFNVVKHSGVTHADVGLHVDDHETVLTVSDAGRGFDTVAGAPTGLGLHGLRERVAAVGGSVAVEAPSEGGTTVVVSLPDHGASPGSGQPDETAALT